MKLPSIKIGPPQRMAALLLLFFLAECLWVVNRQQLSQQDYRYAECGRKMRERPSPLAGYFTPCGNLNGDGPFAYRVAGLPLTVQRLAMRGADELGRPENRLDAASPLHGSLWEARHELFSVKYLLHLPFVFFAMWLGGGLWWVSRRLFGNEGAFFALGLYCFCPAVVRSAVTPNNDVLAMWGLYGLVYAAMGVAHAMQGPRSKWKPRIALMTIALGLTATAHLLAAMIGFVMATVWMMYLAERRRSHVMQILVFSAVGALAIVFGFFAFRLAPFSYVFTGGGARSWFALDGASHFFLDVANGPIAVATLVALMLYVAVRRCRYFGNTAPLVMVLLLFPLVTTQTVSRPWLWALPFLFTFVGGVFADALETRQRRWCFCLFGGIRPSQPQPCLPPVSSNLR